MKALQQKIDAVAAAELACTRQRAGAQDAWRYLTQEVRRTATPGRIVVSGLVLGFASGFSARSTGEAGSKLLSGPIFSMLLETVVPGLLAGLTAAATASGEDEEDSDAEATEDEAEGDADADADAVDDDDDAADDARPRAGRRRADDA